MKVKIDTLTNPRIKFERKKIKENYLQTRIWRDLAMASINWLINFKQQWERKENVHGGDLRVEHD